MRDEQSRITVEGNAVFSLITRSTEPSTAATLPGASTFAVATSDLAVVVAAHGVQGPACTHGGIWFARQLGSQLVAALAPDPELPLPEGLAKAVHAVARLHIYTCDLGAPGAPTASAAALRVGPTTVELLAIGSCGVRVATLDGGADAVDAAGYPVGDEPGVARRATTTSLPRASTGGAQLFDPGQVVIAAADLSPQGIRLIPTADTSPAGR